MSGHDNNANQGCATGVPAARRVAYVSRAGQLAISSCRSLARAFRPQRQRVECSGIISSSARDAMPANKTLGALTGTEYRSVYGVNASFHSVAITNSDLLVKYTYYGDSDFNGEVDGADYARIDSNFNNQVAGGDIGGWFNGDLDYNGKVDGADYALIDSAFNSQGGTLLRMLSFVDDSNRDRNTMSGPALGMVLQHFDQFGENYAAAVIANVPEPSAVGGAISLLATLRFRRNRK